MKDVRAARYRGLPRAFYDRPTLEVARDLIGHLLVHDTPVGRTAGVIIEVEAYIGEADPACHAAPGPTARNRPLYGKPGFAYVYLNYGMHYLVNVVTEPEGSPAAVLIRAVEPVEGLDLMRQRRGAARNGDALSDHELCRGPGNLTRAMGITLADNRKDLSGSTLYVTERNGVADLRRQLLWSSRIGIRVGTEHQWRCFVAGHKGISGKRGMRNAGCGTRMRSER